MNYEKTLEVVENFLKESGIRHFCEKVCRGACCVGCYEANPNACILYNERKLACSIYLCRDLRMLFPHKIRRKFKRVEEHIMGRLHFTKHYMDLYYKRYSDKFKNSRNFDKQIITQLAELDTQQIKIIINEIKAKIENGVSPKDTQYPYIEKIRWKAELLDYPRFIPKKYRPGLVSFI